MTDATSTPVRTQADRWFEDYGPGLVIECGEELVTEDEILSFARRFDPQPFHLDHAAAVADSPFGGLVASGMHTAALMVRMMVLGFLPGQASMGSPGLDEIRWSVPVRPGDRLSLRAEVVSARRSQSKPDRGIVVSHCTVFNQKHEPVMTCKGLHLFRCKTEAAGSPPSRG